MRRIFTASACTTIGPGPSQRSTTPFSSPDESRRRPISVTSWQCQSRTPALFPGRLAALQGSSRRPADSSRKYAALKQPLASGGRCESVPRGQSGCGRRDNPQVATEILRGVPPKHIAQFSKRIRSWVVSNKVTTCRRRICLGPHSLFQWGQPRRGRVEPPPWRQLSLHRPLAACP